MNLKSIVSDAAERSISTGWQVAAGYAIATEVFHDATLTPVVAAVLSVAKSLAVRFYTEHKTEADKIRAEVEPLVEQAIKDYQAAQAAQVTQPAQVVALAPAKPSEVVAASTADADKAAEALAQQVIALNKAV